MSSASEFRELQRQYPCLGRGSYGRWKKIGEDWVIRNYHTQVVDGAFLQAWLRFDASRETLSLEVSLTQHCQQVTATLIVNATYLNPVAVRSEAISLMLESLPALWTDLEAKLQEIEGATAW